MNYLKSYALNISKLVTMLLGSLHRTPKRISWLSACLAGLAKVHSDFRTYTDDQLQQLKYNGQTFVMEQMLQYYFGAGIYITNNLGDADGMVIGSQTDYASSIGSGADFDSNGLIGEDYTIAQFDFTVHVPTNIVFSNDEMNARIRKYKLFGTTYNIVIE